MLKLVITDDEGRTTVVPIDRDEITIGRGEGNTIRLTERNVSRKHAIVRRSGRGFEIEDLKSYNGTKLGGVKIAGPQAVREGERIQVGDYAITLQSARQPVRVGHDGTKTTQITADAETALFSMPEGRPVPRPAPRPLGKPRFVLEAGPGKGRQFVLDKDEATIGQAPECEIRLDHPSVSRTHAKLVNVGTVRILDLNSTNGVRVNGRDVPYAELEPGDLLELGEVKLRFLVPGLPARGGARMPARRSTWLAVGIMGGFAIVGAVLFFAWPAPAPIGDPIVPDPSGTPGSAAPPNAATSTGPARAPADPGSVVGLVATAREHQRVREFEEAIVAGQRAQAMVLASHGDTTMVDELLRELEQQKAAAAKLDRAQDLVTRDPTAALAALDEIPPNTDADTLARAARIAADALRAMLNEARRLGRRSGSKAEAREMVETVLAHARLSPATLPPDLDRVRLEARELKELYSDRPVATVGPRPGGPRPHGGEPPGPNKAPDTPRPAPDEGRRWTELQAAVGTARYKALACRFARDFSSARAKQAQQICRAP